MSPWLQVSLLLPDFLPSDHTGAALSPQTSFSVFLCLSHFMCQMGKVRPFKDEMRSAGVWSFLFSVLSLPFVLLSVGAGILLHSICSQRKGFPVEGTREHLLQDPREPSATSEGPGVARHPGLSSGSEQERQNGS